MTAEHVPIIKDEKEEIKDRLPEKYKSVIYGHTSEQMPEIDEGEIDLVVTSPPYPMIERWDYLGGYEEQHEMIEKVISECYEKLKRGGIMCINIGDATRSKSDHFKYYPNHSRITENAEEIGFSSLIPIHWKKPQNSPNKFMGSGMKPPNAYVTNETEYILIFRKQTKVDPEKPILRRASMYTQEQRNVWFSQEWKVPGATQEGYSQFPFEIPYRLIRMFSLLGDTVLDPFAGTGTTLKAARVLGRHSIGYEQDDEVIPMLKKELESVNHITTEDVLRNIIRVDRDGADPETFYKNPSTLVDIL